MVIPENQLGELLMGFHDAKDATISKHGINIAALFPTKHLPSVNVSTQSPHL